MVIAATLSESRVVGLSAGTKDLIGTQVTESEAETGGVAQQSFVWGEGWGAVLVHSHSPRQNGSQEMATIKP